MAEAKRIEMGVAAGYWDKWTMVHALKELVANAKDSGGNVVMSFTPGFGDKTGLLTIEDDGYGFDKHCLMLGAGETKGRGKIGQFKEGMKGAMLVCARSERMVELRTTGFSLPRVGIEPTQLGPQGFVLYVDEQKKTDVGTVVTVECTEREVLRLAEHFTGIKVDGIQIVTTDDDRLISIPSGKKLGRIFINGALATDDGGWGFNYNFDYEEMDKLGLSSSVENLKLAQNRDRAAVGTSAVEGAVREVLCTLTDPVLIRYLLTAWMDGGRDRREYTIRDLSIPAAILNIWKGVVREIWTGKVCQPPRNEYYLRREGMLDENEILMAISDQGYTSLPGDIPNSIRKIVYDCFPNIHDALDQEARKPQDKVMQAIDKRKWTAEEKAIIEEASAAVSKALCVELPAIGMFVRTFDGLDAAGMFYQRKIWLKQEVVNRANSTSGFEWLCGVIVHEFCHRDGSDRTREFESSLTKMLGVAIAGAVRGPREETLNETLEKEKMGDWSDEFPEVLTIDQITERFPQGFRFTSKTGALNAKQVPEWHYAGVTVHENNSRRNRQYFWFTGRVDNSRNTPATLCVTLKSNLYVTLNCLTAGRGINCIGGWGNGKLDRSVPFADHDMS